jgi:hypothetical protein
VSLAHGWVWRCLQCRSCGGAETLSAWSGRGMQQKGKGKAKDGGGGGPSNKAAAAGSSSGEASTSRGEGSRSSTLPSASAGLRSTVEDAVQAVLPPAEVASGTQQPAGGGKKEKERQRKERQRQRRMFEAREALQVAMEAMALGSRCVSPLWFCDVHCPWELVVSYCSLQGALTCVGACGCSGESALGAVEKATAEAEKHGDRSEPLTALVAEARVMIEQAKAEQAERAKAAAEAAAAAKAAAEAERARVTAERLRLEEQVAALTLRMQSDALQLQEAHAQLGSSVVPPAPHLDAEETQCVVCMDAPKDHIIVPCYHLCVCQACANRLMQMEEPSCPICRRAIQQTNKVFQS